MMYAIKSTLAPDLYLSGIRLPGAQLDHQWKNGLDQAAIFPDVTSVARFIYENVNSWGCGFDFEIVEVVESERLVRDVKIMKVA